MSDQPCHPATRCIKLDRILTSLASDFPPFNQLSPERLGEVLNVVRLVELRPGELLQMPGGRDSDDLFVLEGRLELIKNGVIRTLIAAQDTHKRPVMLAAAPNTSTLLAREPSIICHADRQMLDDLISWDAVVQQGEQGDAFYIITSGRAEVWQTLMSDEPQKIAEIGEGDAFGCEALISGKTRSETVRMLEDGTLLTLGKEDFDWLIGKQMIKSIHPKVARTMMETGYKFVDVRYPEEFEYNHIPGAKLIPLFELRHRMQELDPKDRYIIYCQSGSRSAVAALRLSQAGFDVQPLEGGMREWSFETESLEEA